MENPSGEGFAIQNYASIETPVYDRGHGPFPRWREQFKLVDHHTSLSDVAEMNTVTWGPESSPTLPHRTHKSDASCVNHHVERGTKIVTRSARRRDWEPLSGRRQFAPKDPLPSIKEDLLLAK